MSFDSFVKCVHQPLFLGDTLKSVAADTKVLPLNSYQCENKLDLFLRLVTKGLWRTQGTLAVTEMVNQCL